MKLLISITTLVMLIYGSACKQTTKSEVNLNQTEDEKIEQEIKAHQKRWKDVIPYSMKPTLSQENETQFKIDVIIEPQEGSYILSRYASQDFIGKFTIEIDENPFIKESAMLLESPESDIIYEPFSKSDQKAILKKTTCTQNYRINTTDDFKVTGKIYFVIEPKCTLEEHPFSIIQTHNVISLNML